MAFAALGALLACGTLAPADAPTAAVVDAAIVDPHAAGAPCVSCHPAETAAWAASHHASAQTGTVDQRRFDGVERAVGTLRATPTIVDGAPAFVVADGAGVHSWPVTGTIGVSPLQQYLLDAPQGKRLVAPLAYDVRAAAWFDPAPDGAVGDPGDPLYWAGLAGNWNHQCAACHTTGFQKGFDPSSGAYVSTYRHEHVGCEACHGPATAPRALDEAAAELDACAGCHSRREPLTCSDDPSGPYLDRYRPSLVGSGAFLADGRPAAPVEPFEWGPWVQSRMYAAGVACSDCHEPHSGALLRPGDATCTSCHPVATLAARVPHGAQTDCVSCHMPTSTFMGVHARHDHGLHRPGARGRSAVFAPALAADPAAVPGLLSVALEESASAFDRASALALLRRFGPPADAVRLRPLARTSDALVRAEAIATLGAWGDAESARLALTDPVRAVRFAAIEAYVIAGGNVSDAAPAFGAVLAEVEALATCDDDLPSTHQNLGRLRAATGDRPRAIAAFETLQKLDPSNPAAARALTVLRAQR